VVVTVRARAQDRQELLILVAAAGVVAASVAMAALAVQALLLFGLCEQQHRLQARQLLQRLVATRSTSSTAPARLRIKGLI